MSAQTILQKPPDKSERTLIGKFMRRYVIWLQTENAKAGYLNYVMVEWCSSLLFLACVIACWPLYEAYKEGLPLNGAFSSLYRGEMRQVPMLRLWLFISLAPIWGLLAIHAFACSKGRLNKSSD